MTGKRLEFPPRIESSQRLRAAVLAATAPLQQHRLAPHHEFHDDTASSIPPASPCRRTFRPIRNEVRRGHDALNAKVASAPKPRTRRKARDPESVEVVAAVLPEPADEPEDGELETGEDAQPQPDAGTAPAARRKANQTAQRAESQAACAALQSDILAARRKALSTLTGIAAVALAGLGAYGFITGKGMALAAAAAALLVVACLLCWRRERPMTRPEYLSLPHTQARNGRLRCIHCSSLGASLAEVQSWQGRRHECAKCRKLLFQ